MNRYNKIATVFNAAVLLLLFAGIAFGSGETVNVPIGTLPAGKNITIYYDVLVNHTLPAGKPSVSQQGTVSGTNFSSLLTDDPKTPAIPDDPTVTLLGNMQPVAGFGKALSFNGTDQYVLISDGGLLASSAYTIEAWVKIDTIRATAILHRADATSSSSAYGLYMDASGHFIHYLKDDSGVLHTVTGATTAGAGKWYHLAGVFDSAAGTMHLFVNGVEEGTSVSGISGLLAGMDRYEIGRGLASFGDNFLAGQADEVRIWGKALSGNEILNWMYRGIDISNLNYSSLSAYYQFNDGAGGTASDSALDPGVGPFAGSLQNMSDSNWVAVSSVNEWYTNEDEIFNGRLAGSDQDGASADGANWALIFELVMDGTKGHVVIGPDNSFTYTPILDENGDDTFAYKVKDALSAESDSFTVQVHIAPVNDPPVIAADTGMTLAEYASETTITASMLSLTDVEQSASEITYTVGAATSKGTMKKNGSVLSSGSTFTQDDIDNGRITYTPTTAMYGPDGFTFTASDGAGGNIGSTAFGITITPAQAVSFEVAAPAGSTAGSAFSATVTARDASNNIANGYDGIVHFTSSDAQAVLPANSTLTNGTGTFAVTLKTAGPRSVTATDTGAVTITGTGNVTVVPASASALAVAVPSTSNAGSSFSATVTAKDAFNNTANGYDGIVHFTSSDAQAVLPADSTLTNGTGTFAVTLKTAGPHSVIATDTVTPSVTGAGNITVNATTATRLAFTSQPGNATAGAVFGAQPVVRTQDAFGNNSTVGLGNNINVTLTLSTGTGPLQGTTSGNIGNNGPTPGTFTFTNLRIDNASDTKQLTAAAGVFTSALSNSFAVSPASTSAFAVSAPISENAGAPFNTVITARDAFGNTTTSYSGTVHITSNDAQAILPPDSTLTSGNGTFSVTLKTSGPRTVTATDTITPSISGTANVSINAGPAVAFSVGGPSSSVAGSPFTLTVAAKDLYNNTDQSYIGVVHLTSTDPAAILPADYTFTLGDAGIGTFIAGATMKTAGVQTVTATDVATPGITGTSGSIDVGPGTVTRLSVDAPAVTTAGTPIDVKVTAEDSFNNVVTGYTGMVSFTSTDLKAVLPADYTFIPTDHGSKTFTSASVMKTAGAQTVTATDNATPSVNGTSGSISVAYAPLDHFGISAISSPQTALNPFSITITASDVFGNTVTGFEGSVSLGVTSGSTVSPVATGGFISGVWTGDITVSGAGTDRVVSATNSSGPESGMSNLFDLQKRTQGISVTTSAPGSAVYNTNFSVEATATSGLGVAILASGACDGSGTGSALITMTSGTGTCSVHFSQDGDGNYSAATPITQDTAAQKADQNITFDPLSDRPADSPPFSLGVTASSGLIVDFISQTTAVCGVLGNTVTLTHTTGRCTIVASQTGDSNYNEAGQVSRSFEVSPAALDHIAVSPSVSAITAGGSRTYAVEGFDQYNNSRGDITGSTLFSISPDGSCAGSTCSATVSGPHSVSVNSGGKTAAASLDVNPGPVASFVLSGPAGVTGGLPFSITVTARDAFDNTASGYTGTVNFSSSDGLAVLPGNYTFSAGDAGVRTFSSGFTLRTGGLQTVRAADTLNPSVSGSKGITVNLFSVSATVVSGNGTIACGPSLLIYGDSFSCTACPDRGYDLYRLYDNGSNKRGSCTVDGSCYGYSVSGVTLDHAVKAAYQNYPVILVFGANSETFATIQSAADAAQNNDRIQAQQTLFGENLIFNRPGISASLEGGFDPGFSSSSGYTEILGIITIIDGTLHIRDVIIR